MYGPVLVHATPFYNACFCFFSRCLVLSLSSVVLLPCHLLSVYLEKHTLEIFHSCIFLVYLVILTVYLDNSTFNKKEQICGN